VAVGADGDAIALADGGVFLFVGVALGKVGRQRPDALGVILGVFRVGVDFALARQLEARRLDLLETFNGEIDSCFGPKAVRTSRYAPGSELKFTEGDGAGRVTIRTLNGDLRLCRD
jgi:hypothetical protein